ncbi:MAG TPA: hypothetical protein VIX17_15875 [Pyrinomonadaceae bacterium]|jgi:hypothetical protein
MKNLIAICLCLLLTVPLTVAPVLAQGNSFEVRYVGGSLTSTVKPDDWKNDMTITSEVITLKLKDGQELKIDPKSVKVITHGHQASRRIGTYAALAIVSPVFLLGMLKKNKRNFVGIAFETTDGKKEGVNLQVKNEKYRAMLTALEAVTGLKTEEEPDEKGKKENKDKDKTKTD